MDTLGSRMSRLVLTERQFQVSEQVSAATVQKMHDLVAQYFDEAYDKSRAVKRKLRDMPRLNELLTGSTHCPVPCKYCFQVMTVGAGGSCLVDNCACPGCGVAPKLPRVVADDLHEVPLPMLKPGVDGHLSKFADTAELYGKRTSTKDLPSCSVEGTKRVMTYLPEYRKRDNDVQAKFGKFTSQHVRARILCADCGKWRAVFCSKQPKGARKRLLDAHLSTTYYTCGLMVFEDAVGAGENGDTFVVKACLSCASPMQKAYMTAEVSLGRNKGHGKMFSPCCAHCGDEEGENFVVVQPRAGKAPFPLCKSCKDKKKKPVYSKAPARRSGSAGRSAPAGTDTDTAGPY